MVLMFGITLGAALQKHHDAAKRNSDPQIQISYGYRFWRDLPSGNMFVNPAQLDDPRLYPLLFRIKP